MKKILGIMLLLMISVTSVSANLCDRAVDEELFQEQNPLMDLNGDGVVDLSDIALFSMNSSNDAWCDNQFSAYFSHEDTPFVTGNAAFKENLDKHSTVVMSRNVFWTVARDLQFNGVRYKVGFGWNTVKLYDSDKEEVAFPEGLKVSVEPRTLWTRSLVFTRE